MVWWHILLPTLGVVFRLLSCFQSLVANRATAGRLAEELPRKTTGLVVGEPEQATRVTADQANQGRLEEGGRGLLVAAGVTAQAYVKYEGHGASRVKPAHRPGVVAPGFVGQAVKGR